MKPSVGSAPYPPPNATKCEIGTASGLRRYVNLVQGNEIDIAASQTSGLCTVNFDETRTYAET